MGELLSQQPLAASLGIDQVEAHGSRVRLTLPLHADLLLEHGLVHSSAVLQLADSALNVVGRTALKSPVLVCAFTVRFVRPGMGGGLVAYADVESVGATQATCHCEVYSVLDGAEKLCASAEAILVKIEK